MTLHLARAIHAGNTPSPDIPDAATTTENGDTRNEEVLNTYNAWRSSRRAVVHTLDNNVAHSQHARQVVRNFRNGLYFPHVDFHTGALESYLSGRLEESNNEAFLDHAILDLPSTDEYLEITSKALKPNGILLAFCPSITQINACEMRSKQLDLPLFLEKVIEIGRGIGTGGREWDVRSVKPKTALKRGLGESPSVAEDPVESGAGDKVLPEDAGGGEQMICRPKVGVRVTGGGFVGVWRRIVPYSSEPTGE